MTEVMKWLVGLLQKIFDFRYLKFFFCFCFFFVSCLVGFFFDNYVIGVSQAVARKVFLEHFSGLAFRLLCYIMYRKCTCSRVFLLTFSMDWMMFLKTFYVSRKRLFVRDCLLFRIPLFEQGSEWTRDIESPIHSNK